MRDRAEFRAIGSGKAINNDEKPLLGMEPAVPVITNRDSDAGSNTTKMK